MTLQSRKRRKQAQNNTKKDDLPADRRLRGLRLDSETPSTMKNSQKAAYAAFLRDFGKRVGFSCRSNSVAWTRGWL